MHSTPEIAHTGLFLTIVWCIVWLLITIFLDEPESRGKAGIAFVLIFAPLPVWGLSHLFGPVIAWAFVFAFIYAALLLGILLRMRFPGEIELPGAIYTRSGNSGGVKYRGK